MSGRILALLIAALALVGGGYWFLSWSDEPGARATEAAPTGLLPLGPVLRMERSVPTSASGVVRSDQGEALTGAVVVLRTLEDGGAEPVVARTEEGGAWSLRSVPSGRYAASATAAGYLPQILPDVKLVPAQDNPGIKFTLTSGGNRLHGTVVDLTGGEVEGALIGLTPVEGFLDVRRRDGFGTVTDDNGVYTLSVPDGRYRVRVTQPDYAASAKTVALQGGDREENFQLTPMAVVEGVVVRDSNDKPVPNARIVASSEQTMLLPGGGRQTISGRIQSVTADEHGRFRIRGLEPGPLSLRARAKGLASATPHTLMVSVAQQVANVELRVGAAFAVRGRVVQRGEKRRPIAGATVRAEVSEGGGGSRAETDDDGNFILDGLLPGRYRLLAESSGHLPVFPGKSVDVSADLDDVEIELDPGLVLRGRVEPPQAAKIAAEIRPENMQMGTGMFMLGGGATTVAAEDGTFELKPMGNAPVTVVARAADGRIGERSIDLSQGVPTEEVVIQLEETARVEGRVINARGEPVPGAQVSLKLVQSGPNKITLIVNGRDMGARATPTAEDGSFAIVGLTGGRYEVNITDERGQTLAAPAGDGVGSGTELSELDVADGQRKTGVILTVETADGEISGVVETDDGTPAGDVWVTLLVAPRPLIPEKEESRDEKLREERTMMMVVADGDAGGGTGSASFPPTLTDDAGRFRFQGLQQGDYMVTAEQGGGRSRVSQKNVKPGAHVTLTLAPLASIEGTVILAGKTIDGAVVTASGPTRRTSRVMKGRFKVDGLDPGAYTVSVLTGRASQSKEVTVEAGDHADIELVLEPWATVTGRVVDTNRKPLAGARIMIGAGAAGRVELEMDGSEADVRTDHDGHFETHAPTGKRALVVMGADNPAPIAMKFFVAQGGEEHDLGEIREGERGGRTRVGGDEPGGEGL